MYGAGDVRIETLPDARLIEPTDALVDVTRADVMGTGHHAALSAQVGPSKSVAVPTFFNNVTIGGGVAPVRAYIQELLPDVLEGRIEPGRVFDRVTNLEGVPDGYRAMNGREAIKVLIEF